MNGLSGSDDAAALFAGVSLRDAAIGTGIHPNSKYIQTIVEKLAEVTGSDVKTSVDLMKATSDMGDFVLFSSILQGFATTLS